MIVALCRCLELSSKDIGIQHACFIHGAEVEIVLSITPDLFASGGHDFTSETIF